MADNDKDNVRNTSGDAPAASPPSTSAGASSDATKSEEKKAEKPEAPKLVVGVDESGMPAADPTKDPRIMVEDLLPVSKTSLAAAELAENGRGERFMPQFAPANIPQPATYHEGERISKEKLAEMLAEQKDGEKGGAATDKEVKKAEKSELDENVAAVKALGIPTAESAAKKAAGIK